MATSSTRSYLTAGVAALGVGAIALTPVQPIPNNVALANEPAITTMAVNLAATISPIAVWEDTFKTSASNLGKLFNAYAANPFPVLGTIWSNQGKYISELPDIGLIFKQITGNIGNAFKAPFTAGGEAAISDVATGKPLPVNHKYVYANLPTLVGDSYEKLKPIVEFTTSPFSGLALGWAGPGLSAMIQLSDSIQAIFKAPDFMTGFNEFLNLPAYVTNAGLNGGKFLNLVPVLDALGFALPASVTKFGITTGGVLNGGGVAFDSSDLAATVFGINETIGGIPVGMIGTGISTLNAIGKAIEVTKPTPAAAHIAAAQVAPAVEAPAAPAEAPAAPAIVAPALIDLPEPQAAANPVEAPASTHQARRGPSAAGSDNDNDNHGSAHRGARGAA
jgi:hypothetical protein